MTPLPYLKLHQVSGADAASFLQAQLAADIGSFAVGESGFAAWCSPRGQVIAVFLVCREADGWLLACEARLADHAIEQLRRYVLRARVEFTARDELLLAGLEPDEPPVAGQSLMAPRQSGLCYSTVDRTAVPAASKAASPRVESWRARELMSGLTWLQPATTERFIPQMLGLERIGAVSFAKGCYPGQEIVARTRYLGKLKRKPVLVEIEGLMEMAEPITGNAGDPITVHGEDEAGAPVVTEAVIAETVALAGADGMKSGTLALLVAPLDERATVASIEIAGTTWSARRIATDSAAPGGD